MFCQSFLPKRALLLCGTGLLALAGPALAQDAGPAPNQAEPNDIVVTASRRAETLKDVPQSVTAVTAEDLAKLDATQLTDFANTVPGLGLTTQGAGRTTINLRGVTTGIDVGPTVGIYVDDVPYGASSAFGKASQLALDVGLFDLDRVEVLRGPQGTLYGASSIGGVLKYVTPTPSLTDLSGTARGGVSFIDHGATNFNGAASINAPVVNDAVGVRASGFFSRSGGYIDNVATGEDDVDRSDIYGGRVDVLIKPTDRLSIRLTGFGQNIRRDGTLASDFTLAGRPLNGALSQGNRLREEFNADFRLGSGTIAYEFGGASLTSVSSYQFVKNQSVSDASAVYVPTLQGLALLIPDLAPVFNAVGAVDIAETDETKKFAQELRLASTGAQTIEWLVGGFYTHEKSDADQATNSYLATLDPFPALNIGAVRVLSTYEEIAAFGNLTWHLTDALDVTGGVRWAHNEQDFEQIGSGLLIGSQPKQSSSESVVTYLANARYRISPHVTAYARFATGYRPGGPNYLVTDPITGTPLTTATYRSDTLNSYELGLKGETADRTVGFDLSAYLIDWRDIQVATAAGGVSFIGNAGKARVKGAELTLTARPDPNFVASGAFAYNDGELREDNADLGARAGERLPNAPHVTAAVNADWTLTTSDARPSLGGTVRFVGDRTASFDGNVGLPQYDLPSYVSVDLRGGAGIGPVDLQVYVHNLFDTRGQLGAVTAFASAGGPARVAIAQPRTIGLSARTRF